MRIFLTLALSRIGLLCALCVSAVNACFSQVNRDTPGWYEFSMPGLGPLAPEIDISYLNEVPAGKDGPIKAKDGHFVDGQGRRIRFFGTNLTATACFTDKATAPGAAQHLRSLGFNLVRLHFMDIAPPNGMLREDGTLDPDQLDKLDFLISELKKNGIYVNMNLHVARRYPGIEGEAAKRFGFGKVLDHFYPAFIEMQKDYARKLLGHQNPYTGLIYAQEPSVFCVELNNENTMLPFWGGNTENLPEPFGSELQRQWNAWLKSRYTSTPALAKAWDQGKKEAGPEILRNPDFSQGNQEWLVQSAGGAESSLESSKGILTWKAIQAGTESWNLQLQQDRVPLQGGRSYILSFKARADKAIPIMVGLMLNGPPWTALGLMSPVSLDTEWKSFELGFQSSDPGSTPVRLNVSTNNKTGTFEFASLSLREAGAKGLPPSESLEKANVTKPGAGATAQARLDHWTFLIETDRNYTGDMLAFLRKDLGVQSMLVGSQADYGDLAGLVRENELSDFIDVHGYWQHPEFHGADWSATDWSIANTAQSASLENTLTTMATRRVQGKPFAVSEYNVPAPSDYAAETLPMFAAFAAFQDWDAIYAYTYLDFSPDWDSRKIIGFFSFCGHPGKLVFAPAAALIFRNAWVPPALNGYTLQFSGNSVAQMTAVGQGDIETLWKKAMNETRAPWLWRLGLDSFGRGSSPALVKSSPWIMTTPENPKGLLSPEAVFLAGTEWVGMASGKLTRESIARGFGSATLTSGPNLPYTCLTLVPLDGTPLAQSKKILVSLAGRVENQNMAWNASRTSVSDKWGSGPTVAELVKASLSLRGSWKAQALDGRGSPVNQIPTHERDGNTYIPFGDKYPSLWYLLTR